MIRKHNQWVPPHLETDRLKCISVPLLLLFPSYTSKIYFLIFSCGNHSFCLLQKFKEISA